MARTHRRFFLILWLLLGLGPRLGWGSPQSVPQLVPVLTEEGQQVVFRQPPWQYRELAKRLPLEEPRPAQGEEMKKALVRFGLDRDAPPFQIPHPSRIITDIYPGQVIVSAADPITDWQRVAGQKAVYFAAWAHDFIADKTKTGIAARIKSSMRPFAPVFCAEMFISQGKPLRQAMRLEDLAEGKFFVNWDAQQVLRTCHGDKFAPLAFDRPLVSPRIYPPLPPAVGAAFSEAHIGDTVTIPVWGRAGFEQKDGKTTVLVEDVRTC